jgi:hypothetical protein
MTRLTIQDPTPTRISAAASGFAVCGERGSRGARPWSAIAPRGAACPARARCRAVSRPKMNPPTWAKNATPPPFAEALNGPKFTSISCHKDHGPRMIQAGIRTRKIGKMCVRIREPGWRPFPALPAAGQESSTGIDGVAPATTELVNTEARRIIEECYEHALARCAAAGPTGMYAPGTKTPDEDKAYAGAVIRRATPSRRGRPRRDRRITAETRNGGVRWLTRPRAETGAAAPTAASASRRPRRPPIPRRCRTGNARRSRPGTYPRPPRAPRPVPPGRAFPARRRWQTPPRRRRARTETRW